MASLPGSLDSAHGDRNVSSPLMHSPSSSSAPGRREADAASLLDLAALFGRRWKFIAAYDLAGAVVAAVWSLVATPRYRSTLKFALEEQAAPGALGGLAALTGQFSLGLGGPRSLQFYSEVLTGRDLLERLALDSFPIPDGAAQRAPLVEILGFTGDSEPERLADAHRFLVDRAVTTTTNDRTGIITLEVTLPDPDLAAGVAQRLFERLGQFNVETRRSAATERRRFTERELAGAAERLAAAESDMRAFLESNLGGLEGPRLSYRRQQLQRRIDLLNEVYSQLARETQSARIDEVRDMPVFTLVQTAA